MLNCGHCSLMVVVIFLLFKTSMLAIIEVTITLMFWQFSSMIVLHLPSMTRVVSLHLMRAYP